jgi:hypothetical protein
MTWFSLHAHRHDGAFEPLLLDAVRPLFARLDGHVEAAYWLRHWQRGPHLRLQVRCPDPMFRQFVVPETNALVGGYLAAHPSRDETDPQDRLAEHTRLAEVERQDGPLLPWAPDNSIVEAPYEDRLHVLGTPEAADLLAAFYAESTPLAFAMLDHLRRGGSRRGLALNLMLATAHALSGKGITDAFVSFRSHAEAFTHVTAEGRRMRPHWDRLYEGPAEALVRRVRAVVSAVDEGEPRLPFVTEWVELLRSVRARGDALIAAGRLPMAMADARDAAGDRPTVSDLSPFHRDLETAGRAHWERLRGSAGFAGYRLVLNDTYLHLTRLGIGSTERFLLCHLAANAVESAYGVSAAEVVRS